MQSSMKQISSTNPTENVASKRPKEKLCSTKFNNPSIQPLSVEKKKRVNSKQEKNKTTELSQEPLPFRKFHQNTKVEKNLDQPKILKKPKTQAVKLGKKSNGNFLNAQANIISEQAFSFVKDKKKAKVPSVLKSKLIAVIHNEEDNTNKIGGNFSQKEFNDSFEDDFEDFLDDEHLSGSQAISQLSKTSSKTSLMEVDDIMEDVFGTNSNSSGQINEKSQRQLVETADSDRGKSDFDANSDESGIQNDSSNALQFPYSDSNEFTDEDEKSQCHYYEDDETDNKMEVDEFLVQSDQNMSDCETPKKTKSKNASRSREDVYNDLKRKLKEKEKEMNLPSNMQRTCNSEEEVDKYLSVTSETPKSSKENIKKELPENLETPRMNSSRRPTPLPPLVFDKTEFVTPVGIRIKPKINLDPPKVQKHIQKIDNDNIILNTLRQQYPQFEITLKTIQSPLFQGEDIKPKFSNNQFNFNASQNHKYRSDFSASMEDLYPDSWENPKLDILSSRDNSSSDSPQNTQKSTEPWLPYTNNNEAAAAAYSACFNNNVHQSAPLSDEMPQDQSRQRNHYSEEQDRLIVELYAQMFVHSPGTAPAEIAEAIQKRGNFPQKLPNFLQHIRRILKPRIFEKIKELRRDL